MKMLRLILLLLVGSLLLGCQEQQLSQRRVKRYEPTWESLREYKEVPGWLRDGKYGIYTHWGPYAVYTNKDIRFTVKGDTLYATFLAWTGEEAIIHTLRGAGDEDDDEDEDEDIPSLAGKTFTIGRDDAECSVTAESSIGR